MDIYQVIMNNMRINGSEDCSTSEFESDVAAAAEIINLHIAALEARLQEAEAIIKPFANEDFSRELSGNFEGDLSPVFQRVQAMLTLGDFRRARAFLNHR